MPTYTVTDRTQATTWVLSQAGVPRGGGRARVHLLGTLSAVHMGQTLNFEVNERHTGLVTSGLTFCCAVCMVRFVDGAMVRASMHHVLGGNVGHVNWGRLTQDMAPSAGTKVVVVWNEGPAPDEMTRAIVSNTSVPESNIYHYLSSNHGSLAGTTFAILWPCFVGEWR